MIRLLTVCIFLCGTIFAQAQQMTGTVRGTIRDADSGVPLEGATVTLLREQPVKGAYTDAQGRFRISEVATGRYTLRISYVGYEPGNVPNVLVNSGKEVVLQLSLTEAVITTEAVEIIGISKEDARNEMTTVSARQFSIDETSRYAGSWNDPARMASNFAGVTPANDSRNDIIIRGNSPSGVLWRLDGVDIPNPNHFASFGTTGGPVSILNNNVLDNSDFMTGAFPAQYGNALAGVFDLRMRKGNDEQYEFLGQFGLNGLEFMAEGPISKKSGASFLVNYRYSTLELMKDLGIEFGTSSQPKYQDLSFKVHFPSKKIGDISIFGIGGLSNTRVLDSERDSSDFFGPAGNDIDFGTNTGALGIRHQLFIGKQTLLRSTLSVNGSTQTTSVDNVDPETKIATPFYRNDSWQGKLSYNVLLNSKLSPRHTIRTGVFVDRLLFDLVDSLQWIAGDGFVTLTDVDGGAWLLQPYAQWKWRLSEKFTLNSGLHSQVFSHNGAWALEPRLGLRWNMADRHTMGLAYGEHSQLQALFVYFAAEELPDGSTVRPNENLDFTRSRHFVLSYDWSIGKNLRLKSEAYYQRLRSVPVEANVSSSFTLLDEGSDYVLVIPDSLENSGTGRNYGLELTFEKFFSKGYYFLLTGSVFDSRYTGSDGIERSTKFNNSYALSALGGLEQPLGKRKRLILGFDTRISAAGGIRYTPLDLVASQNAPIPLYDRSRANSLRFRDYFRTDIRFKIRLNSKKVSQELAIDISNIFNNQNPLNVVYDRSTNALRTNYQIGFFPVAQYRIEF